MAHRFNSPPPARSLPVLVCAGGLLLTGLAASLPAAPPPTDGKPPASEIVAEGDRLADTKKGAAYRQACNPTLVQAVQRVLRHWEGAPKARFLCDFVVMVGADGHVRQAIVANDAFSIQLTDELRKLTLPTPPRDGWPLSVHWQMDLRPKS